MKQSLASSRAPLHAQPQKLPQKYPLSVGDHSAPASACPGPEGAGLGNNSVTPAFPPYSRGRGGYRAAVRQMTAQRLVASYWGEHSENLKGSSVIGCGRWKAFGRSLVAEIKVEGDRAFMDGHFHCGCSWTCESCARQTVASNRSWLTDALFPALKKNGLTGSLVTLTLSHSYEVDWKIAVTDLKKAFTLMDRRLAKIYKKAGCIGKYKAFEVTVGRHGLHPHFHLLVTHDKQADTEALADAMRSAWLAAVEEVGAYCDPVHGFDFKEDCLNTYVAKLDSAHELASQSTKKGRGKGRTLSQLLDASGAGDDTAGAEWQRAIAALGATNRFHAGALPKKLGILTPTEWEEQAAKSLAQPVDPVEGDAVESAADVVPDAAQSQVIPEPATIIQYSLDDHILATNPASRRAALALILRAARRGGKPAVLRMVHALVEDNRKRMNRQLH